jgi:arylsulfatase A-like enzyme
VAIGIALGIDEAIDQKYIARGFILNTIDCLGARLHPAAIGGAAVGLLVALGLGIGSHFERRRRQQQPPKAHGGKTEGQLRSTSFAAPALAGAAALAILALRARGGADVSAGTILWATGLAAIWSIARALVPRFASSILPRAGDAHRHVRSFLDAILAAAIPVWGLLAGYPLPRVLALHALAAAALVALAVFVPRVTAALSPRATAPQRALRVLLFATALVLVIAPLLVEIAWPVAARLTGRSGGALNIVLIGIDTLRSDHVCLAGNAEPHDCRTPNLCRLAARGTVFTDAISQAPWTLPSFASIVTGRYPEEHGATAIYGVLGETQTTLAEVLRGAGYETRGAVSHLFVDSAHGFAQGFADYDESMSLGHDAITSQGVTDVAIRFLDTMPDRRFLLFLHYFDPHYEFMDHAEWDYADGYQGWLRQDARDINNLVAKRHLIDSVGVDYLRDLYDEEIAYTDREIGRLLERLEARGLARETLIVVVADHGEEFMEHGWLGHTITLHDEVVRVPLLIAHPDSAGTRRSVQGLVETRALFSTILDGSGIDGAGAAANRKPPAFAGSLLPSMRAGGDSAGENVESVPGFGAAYSSVTITDAPWSSGKRVRLSSLRTKEWTLIADHTRGIDLLYRAGELPAERDNVAAAEPDVLRSMKAALAGWMRHGDVEMADAPASEPAPDVVEKLRSLGYL